MNDLANWTTAEIERQRDRLALIHPAEAVRAGQLESALGEVLRLRRLLAATDSIPKLKP